MIRLQTYTFFGVFVFVAVIGILLFRKLKIKDAVPNTVKAIGSSIGIPETNVDQCAADIEAGKTWDSSFSCDAGTWIKSLFGVKPMHKDIPEKKLRSNPSGNATNVNLPRDYGPGPSEIPSQNPDGIAAGNPPPGPTNTSGRITKPSINRSNMPRANGNTDYSGGSNPLPPSNNQDEIDTSQNTIVF